MNSPLISIVMTVYNPGRYLKEAVDSLLNQTYTNFELVMIDDASTDGAVQAIKDTYQDPRIRIYRNAENLGQTKSLNKGLHLAQGEWVARLDADDKAYKDWLSIQAQYLASHPLCAVVSCRALVMDQHGKVYKTLNSPLGWENIVLKSLVFSPINHVGSLMRRSIILQQGGYTETFRIAADFDLWTKLIRSGHQLASTDAIGVCIRVHGKSVTAQYRGKEDEQEIIKVMQTHIPAVTGTVLLREELQNLCQLIYNTVNLPLEQFIQATQILRSVYTDVLPQYKVSPAIVRNFLKQTEEILAIKRILKYIGERDFISAKTVADHFKKQYGFCNLLFAPSVFLKAAMVQIVPNAYLVCQKLKIGRVHHS